MALKITSTGDQPDLVTFLLAGKVSEDAVVRLDEMINRAKQSHKSVVLDLSEVTLLDRTTVVFFAEQMERGVRVVNCPSYIQRWIPRENFDEAKT
jgi:ABC-type transporter Mla MlaB component